MADPLLMPEDMQALRDGVLGGDESSISILEAGLKAGHPQAVAVWNRIRAAGGKPQPENVPTPQERAQLSPFHPMSLQAMSESGQRGVQYVADTATALAGTPLLPLPKPVARGIANVVGGMATIGATLPGTVQADLTAKPNLGGVVNAVGHATGAIFIRDQAAKLFTHPIDTLVNEPVETFAAAIPFIAPFLRDSAIGRVASIQDAKVPVAETLDGLVAHATSPEKPAVSLPIEPPVQPGFVRLYRGELGGPYPPSSDAAFSKGHWFSTNREAARFFGPVKFVDVPQAVADAAKVTDEGAYTSTGHYLPPEWANKAHATSPEEPVATTPSLPGTGRKPGSTYIEEKYSDLRSIHDPAWAAIRDVASASGASAYKLAKHTDMIGIGKAARNDLMALLIDENRARIGNLDPDMPPLDNNVPELSPGRKAQILADPQVRKGLAYYENVIYPEIRELSLAAGVSPESIARTEGSVGNHFVHLVPLDMSAEAVPGGVPKTKGGGIGRKLPGIIGRRRTGFAKQATGMAERYATDFDTVMANSYAKTVGTGRINGLFDMLSKPIEEGGVAIVPDAEGVLPKEVTIGGKVYPVKKLAIRHPASGRLLDTALPAPLADAANAVVNDIRDASPAWMRKMTNTSVGIALMLPAEIVRHGINSVGRLAGAESLGRNMLARSLNNMGPLGTWAATTIDTIKALDSPEGLAMRDLLGEHGGLRSAGFGGPGQFGGTRIPVLKQMKGLMFDVTGIESRMRTALGLAIQRTEPGVTPTDLAFRVNAEMGAYEPGLQPALVRRLKDFPIFGDPFAAAGVATVKGSIKNLFGFGSGKTGWSAKVFARMVPASVAFAYMWNKAMDPEHRDPSKIPNLPPLHLILWHDGENLRTLAPGIWMPGVARGLKATGLQAIMGYKPGDTASSVGENVARDMINTVGSRIGPLGRAVTTATLGRAPYVTGSGELMRTSPVVPPGGNQVLQNVKSAVGNLNTAVSEVTGTKPERGLTTGEKVAETFGLAPSTQPPERVAKGLPARITGAKMAAFVDDTVRQALTFGTPAQRQEFIAKTMRTVEPAQRGRVLNMINQAMSRKRRGFIRSAGQVKAKEAAQ